MSRHRDIKNLSKDDYYDYDDDYYYEDEEDYGEYDDGESDYPDVKKESFQSTLKHVKKTTTNAKIPEKKEVSFSLSKSKPVENMSSSDKNKLEKERLVTSMGFNIQDAQQALAKYDWDAQRAINYLLSGTSSGSKTTTMAPPSPEVVAASASTSKTLKTRVPPSSSSFNASATSSTSKSSKPVSKKSKDSSSQQKTASYHASYPKKMIPKDLQDKLKSQKSRLTMVILGHVDHGKSTLMGQVLVQTGMVDKRTVSKYEKQAGEIGKASFALAWIMDEDESERERGVTIDIATKSISTKSHDITILDAPGHADFIPAMISGTGLSDVGILVVSSAKGEFEAGFDIASSSNRHSGQTREHITLARGLGVSQLIVAINKLDSTEPLWSQERFEEIKARVEPFLRTNGFNMNRVVFIPVSALSGINIKTKPEKDTTASDLARWYNGQTLLEAIDNFQPAKRNIDKPFRFIISDIFQEGKGVIVKGRVAQGIISVGDKVCILPLGDIATVNRVDHSVGDKIDPERMEVALAGESISMVLIGIDIARITVGNIISDADYSLRPAIQKKFRAKILVMDDISVPIIRGSQFLLHMHTLDVPATVSTIISKTNKDGSEISNPRVLVGGSNACVEIKLHEKLCLETFAECKALGRIVLRRGGDTVGVGVIESLIQS